MTILKDRVEVSCVENNVFEVNGGNWKSVSISL